MSPNCTWESKHLFLRKRLSLVCMTGDMAMGEPSILQAPAPPVVARHTPSLLHAPICTAGRDLGGRCHILLALFRLLLGGDGVCVLGSLGAR